MTRRGPFVILSGSTVLARIPLLPAAERGSQLAAVDPLLVEGIFIASRQAGMARVAACHAEQVRLAATVRAYELRGRFRPTPHGVFPGVAVARVTDSDAGLCLGGEHRVRTCPSPAWLAALSDRVLNMPEVLWLLRLTTNNLIARRGRRLEHEQQATPGVAAPQRVSIRATDACALILRVCERDASYQTVVAEAVRKWPNAPEGLIRSTVLKMVRGGFLLTDLVPESNHYDALGHVLAKLPDSCALRQPLKRLRGHLRDADWTPPGTPERLAELMAARTVCDELAYVERPLSVDVVADAHITVPASLAEEEAAEAVGVLWRVSQARDALADYHRRFLERYGLNRFVPLLDVADPSIGLGDIEAETKSEAVTLPSKRGTILAALLHGAITHGRMEVELDETTVDALDKHCTDMPPPPTAEVYARVLAASEKDLGVGRLSLAIYGGGTQQAGSTIGRFATLLPDPGIDLTADGSALVAELAVRPRTPELAGVAPPTGFVPTRIPVGAPARDDDLDLRDLLLVSNGERLMLWSAEHGRQVVPAFYSRIGPRYVPPLARLLQELGMQGCRPWHGWSWEPLHHSPFQPRIRYKRTVLSPARWRLPIALTTAARDRSTWGPALGSWQTKTIPRPPEIVVVEGADRQLPLDLRRDSDRELLRRYVCRGLETVTEQPGGPDVVQAVVAGPTGRHVLELVIPLVNQVTTPSKMPCLTVRARPLGDGLYLPGSEWLSLAIPSPSSCHDEILRWLAELVIDMSDHFDRWFWLRYNNTVHGPHVRVRFHGDPATLGSKVLPTLSAWCSDLIAQRLVNGFTVEPYDQEIERYGGHKAIGAAERVFDADSRLVLAALTALPDTDHRFVVAALSAATIARAVADCDLAALDGRKVDRAARRRMSELRPLVRTAAETGSTAISPIRPAWIDRDSALVDHRERLRDSRRADCASSLIHMHTNRLLGDLDSERIARALAADILAREARR
ncbi:MAG: lantibiotic dehydratase [Pseudonocardiales bacterium]|nr:lantibiotic dehydratase [Pseudonocardiales bacterium]